ncbi:winged helix-turn-helix domain-containing protein [Streptomyces scabiei]|uniref:helix-turn-helix domain-containing protein n=1 Tax=Streptomyces scabiei TaxID=1930 RepID=UPI001BB57FC1|nr:MULTISPECIES: winged helix-turn-helix domain-containing protein [Streptomyces]MBP5871449.1 winged helix-turn-helix domain-containing protein [Streptomyces sp. LBUM 1485]MBP5912576.1 winged helix-turn-helix domain-containing protein [Streptomyces sp. LBUM 1486]MDX3029364.1 winged helix-turn-helix domain-containing protein [Streptomyces scabiei]MDX3207970.1 winged helix-turn-helix domain-containing protein [Streptomyces scabiei]MDX3278102.1 winged helix-turn-helix domain-containing protein [S
MRRSYRLHAPAQQDPDAVTGSLSDLSRIGPSAQLAHGRPDQTWTLARIQTLIVRRLYESMTLSATAPMLHGHGFGHQAPARRAVERDEEAVMSALPRARLR